MMTMEELYDELRDDVVRAAANAASQWPSVDKHDVEQELWVFITEHQAKLDDVERWQVRAQLKREARSACWRMVKQDPVFLVYSTGEVAVLLEAKWAGKLDGLPVRQDAMHVEHVLQHSDLAERFYAPPTGSGHDPERTFIVPTMMADLDRGWVQLTLEDRQALFMRYAFPSETNEYLAEVLGLATSTFHRRHRHALRRLTDQMNHVHYVGRDAV